FAGSLPRPIKAYDEAGAVIYISSFSKMIAPAMRLGWIVAPADIVSRLAVLREAIDLESSQLLQRVVTEFLARGYLDEHLQGLNAANHARRNAMLAARERELGGLAEWTVPDGGLFLWVTLPAQVDTEALFERAFRAGVAYIPGVNFSAEQRYTNA